MSCFFIDQFGTSPFGFFNQASLVLSHTEISLMAIEWFLSTVVLSQQYVLILDKSMIAWLLFIGLIVQVLSTSKKVLNRHHADPFLERERERERERITSSYKIWCTRNRLNLWTFYVHVRLCAFGSSESSLFSVILVAMAQLFCAVQSSCT